MTWTPAEQRIAQIRAAAIALSLEGRLYDISLDEIGEQVGLSRMGVRRYYNSARALQDWLIMDAIERGDVDIVNQALAKHDPLVANIPDKLRKACARSMLR